VSGRLKSGNHVHSAAYTANQRIAKQYGGATSDSGGLVLDLPAGQTVQSPAVQAELTAVDAGLSGVASTAHGLLRHDGQPDAGRLILAGGVVVPGNAAQCGPEIHSRSLGGHRAPSIAHDPRDDLVCFGTSTTGRRPPTARRVPTTARSASSPASEVSTSRS
jgi:hypothetical protein